MSEPHDPPTDYRMSPGLGVIEWQGRLLVYQLQEGRIAWARPLGEACLEVDDALRSAIETDQRKSAHHRLR
ncbi:MULTISPECIES: hypothetical protein [Hydrocarboniphaga]|jgi:hypothetical protein|uniref:Uncharacterized protein n=1 Tax=Hydrocarboniphaga effusa AP103 TaxID=1172194 RepID=I8HZA2_9GAMM|nr:MULTISPECIES: hypothetical protein [Hydrocarboniphaga]EIT68906.1 hypothetical protein WQQ_24880 [Hydrocarboniphaga effusa AP103]MDZ4080565.1 hypothetical protein [Hydrocarboniphaga sp.]